MSKSLGNVLSIPAVLQRVRPAELRYYLGSAHYRSMLEFSETALQDAAKAYTGIEEFLHRVRSRVGAVVPGDWTREVRRRARRRSGRARRARRGARGRAEGNRALDAGDHDAAMAHATSIRAMMGILGCDPLDERWESRDETSAALAAIDELVRWALTGRAESPRTAKLGAGRRNSRPAQGGGHRRHRYRRWAAMDIARRQQMTGERSDGKHGSGERTTSIWPAIPSGAAQCARTAPRRGRRSVPAASGAVGSKAKGATPPAHARPHHPAGKRAATAAQAAAWTASSKTEDTARSCSAATRCSNACARACPPPPCR